MAVAARSRSAGETAVPQVSIPQFDLRTGRDLLGRRIGREVLRRAIRVGALLINDALGSGVALATAVGFTQGWDSALGHAWSPQVRLVSVLTIFALAAFGGYGSGRARRSIERPAVALVVALLASTLVNSSAVDSPFTATAGAIYLAVALGLMGSGRLAIDHSVRVIYRAGRGRKNTLIIGSSEDALDVINHYRRAEERDVRIAGFLTPTPTADQAALGSVERLADLLEELDVHNVVITARLEPDGFRQVVNTCFQHGIAVGVVPGMLTEYTCRVTGRDLAGWPLLELCVPRLHLAQLILKRAVDIVLATLGIVVLAPLMAAVAVAVKVDSPGPVLFRQKRLGAGGRPFTIYKFRSMRSDAEEVLRSNPELLERYIANNYKLPEGQDPRVSRLGRFLRKSSLDELPQLFNVIRGDMSLVGPRPIVPKELEEYGDRASVFLAVKPGVTGYWQISGRSEIGYPQRAELDIHYVVSWSLVLDFRILVLTIPHILRRQGAH